MNYRSILIDAQIAAMKAALLTLKNDGETEPFGSQYIATRQITERNEEFIKTAIELGIGTIKDGCNGFKHGWHLTDPDRTNSQSFAVHDAAVKAFVQVMEANGVSLKKLGLFQASPVSRSQWILNRRPVTQCPIDIKEERESGMYKGYYDNFVLDETGIITYGPFRFANQHLKTVAESLITGKLDKLNEEKEAIASGVWIAKKVYHSIKIEAQKAA